MPVWSSPIMNATLLIVGIILSPGQSTDAVKRSLEAIAKSEGKVDYDDKAPDRPVISVDL